MKFLNWQSLLQEMRLGFIRVFHMMEVLRKQYDKFKDKMVPTEDIIKMAYFVLKNNLFEFDCKFYQQISGTTIGTKFACIYMDHIETEFLKTQAINPWLCKRFIDDIFFNWAGSDENLNKSLKVLNEFHSNLKFTYYKSNGKIIFLDSFNLQIIKL